jgi:hypothetical protein
VNYTFLILNDKIMVPVISLFSYYKYMNTYKICAGRIFFWAFNFFIFIIIKHNKETPVIMLISTALLLDSSIRNSVQLVAKKSGNIKSK